MIRLFVRHTVKSYATWKKAYDGFAPVQKRLGVRAKAVFAGAKDPNDVTVWHDFDTLAAAEAFVKSPELADAMKTAGVVGVPTAWFAHRDLPT
jgi:hypothetical protein